MNSAAQQSQGETVPVLEARDVKVHFGGVAAVDGVSIRLMPGLIHGIIGPNGSGKSTLIGALTRLTPLTSGTLLFDGEEYQGESAARFASRGVARTFQTVRLLNDLDVFGNVQLGADMARSASTGSVLTRLRRLGTSVRSGDGASAWQRASTLLRRSASPAVVEALRRTNLHGYERWYPSELSYGTQRRVEIARALATNPRLLLLDEPTAGMNQVERAEVSALLKSLRADGLCLLLVEHDVQMIVDTCDHVFAMNFGRLIAEGRPEDVVRDPQVQEAYLGRKWRDHARG